MRFNPGKMLLLLLAVLVLTLMTTDSVSTAPPPAAPPNPILVFLGQEFYEANGKQWTRYKFFVFNREAYPNEMFAPAPELPPCGNNTKSSRTWVDIYTQAGKRLYGFCALANRDGLGRLWFAMEREIIPPSWVYIELNDRKTNTKYKSNLAETTD